MARRNDGKETRAPLDAGNPRRLTDARCAWRKMTPEQRTAFLLEIGAERTQADGIARTGAAGYWVPMGATEA